MRRAVFLVFMLLSITPACSDTVADDADEPSEGWTMPGTCGDGVAAGDEVCDSSDLAQMTCEDFGFPRGELRCKDNCAGYLVEGCAGVPSWTSTEPSPCGQCAADEICTEGACVSRASSGSLEQGSYTADVKVVTVRGRVTMDGQPLTGMAQRLGALTFRGEESHYRSAYAELDSDGAYETRIWAGEYRVYWYRRDTDGELPTGGKMLESSFRVDAPSRLDLDLPRPVRFSGRLLLDGEPRPVDGPLRFIPTRVLDWDERSMLEAELPMGAYTEPEFSVLLFPGTYDGTFVSYNMIGARPPLFENLRIHQDTERDFNYPLFDVRGDLELPEPLRGQGITDVVVYAVSSNGNLLSHGEYAAVDEAGQFEVELPPGRYAIDYRVHNDEFTYEPPYQFIEVSADTQVDAPGPLELVPIAGRVSPMPQPQGDDEVGPRLVFVRDDERIVRTAPLDDDDRFATDIPAGRYTVYAYPDRDSAYDRYPNASNHVRRVTVDTVTVDGPTQLDLRVPPPPEAVEPVRVHGVITRLGEPLMEVSPESPGSVPKCDRGELVFECVEEESCYTPPSTTRIPAEGPAWWDADLLPGVAYRVVFQPTHPNSNSSEPCSHPPDLPFYRYVLHPRLVVDGEMRHDLDIKLARIQTSLTAHGEAPPQPADYGIDADWSTGAGIVDSQTGVLPASETGRTVVPGHYRLRPIFSPLGHGEEAPPRPVIIGDDGHYTIDIPLHHARFTLTNDGAAFDADEPIGTIYTQTPRRRYHNEVDGDGNAHVWWVGDAVSFGFAGSRESGLPRGDTRLESSR